MRLPGAIRPGASSALLVLASVCGAALALPLVFMVSDLSREATLTLTAYGAGAAFAVTSAAAAARRLEGAYRALWATLGAALLLRTLGDASWASARLLGVGPGTVTFHDTAHTLSYLLLLAALLWLVARTTRRVALTSALDATSIMLSVGMLAWYSVLAPVAGSLDRWHDVLVTLIRISSGAGLLYLGLVVLSTSRRPPFAGFLTGAFAMFLAADAVYLVLRSAGPYEAGNLAELAWAAGFVLLGLAALKAISAPGSGGGESQIQPWRVFSFWLGPLSPAVHCAILLAWGALYPPLPSYMLLGVAAVILYLALRISWTTYVGRKLRHDGQLLAVRQEQGRVSEELHGTLKQSVHGVSMLLDSCQEARKQGDDEQAEELLRQALRASQEASYQVDRPIGELRARCAGSGPAPETLFGQLLENVERYSAVKPHRDLRADLSRLGPEELAAAYRVASEGLWNAVRHSGADNVWLESREVGSVVLLRVRDGGRGFCEKAAGGYGLSLMRARAREAGGELDVISRPGNGATVQVRFDKS